MDDTYTTQRVHDRVVGIERADALAVHELSNRIAEQFESSEDPELISQLSDLAQQLPRRLRQHLEAFRQQADHPPFLTLRGHTIDQRALGRTPMTWRGKVGRDPAFVEETLVLLYSAVLGEPFAWRTQQDGRMVHDVFPIERDELAQLGTGSRELLTWHTEDAFHPHRADYLLLFALRNPDRVATTVGSLDVAQLDSEVLETLFEPRFCIRPDESHLAENNTTADEALGSFEQILHMRSEPALISVLEGDRSRPHLRLDPYFMSTPLGDTRAQRALSAITAAINSQLLDVVLEAGDVLVLDNRRAVHGRRSFIARFDGTDRWLKRINITRDLAKSRSMRRSATCRKIG